MTADKLAGVTYTIYIVQNEIENWFGADYKKLNIIATYNLIFNATIMVE